MCLEVSFNVKCSPSFTHWCAVGVCDFGFQLVDRGRCWTHWIHGWGVPERHSLPWWRLEGCCWALHWCGERSVLTCSKHFLQMLSKSWCHSWLYINELLFFPEWRKEPQPWRVWLSPRLDVGGWVDCGHQQSRGRSRCRRSSHRLIYTVFVGIINNVCTLQAGSMELPSLQMTSPGPGSLQRRCIMSTAGGGSFDPAGEMHFLQELLWRSVCQLGSVCSVVLCMKLNGDFYRSGFHFCSQRQDRGDPEGWEFSSLIGWKFHRKERSSDTFRRRRWRRKMAPEDRLGAAAIFQLEGALVSKERKTQIVPQIKYHPLRSSQRFHNFWLIFLKY